MCVCVWGFVCVCVYVKDTGVIRVLNVCVCLCDVCISTCARVCERDVCVINVFVCMWMCAGVCML